MRSARGDLTHPRPGTTHRGLSEAGAGPRVSAATSPPGPAPGTGRWTCGLLHLPIRRASPTQASPSLLWAFIPLTLSCLGPGPHFPSGHQLLVFPLRSICTLPSAALPLPWLPSTPGRSPQALRALLPTALQLQV